MANTISLDRVNYMKIGAQQPNKPLTLDYLSSKYTNIRFRIPSYTQYQIKDSDRINIRGLAYRFYNDSAYWWVLALYNGVINVLEDLEVGRFIDVPSLSDIDALLAETQDTITESVVKL